MELTSAKIYKKQGEFAKALEFYDQAVAKDPSDPEALFERGELLGEIAMNEMHWVCARRRPAA
ncbi:MAG: tetratricopeptide repeat protein [bacterium]|nr:tetratricopeptide repeat protein [bacterium]